MPELLQLEHQGQGGSSSSTIAELGGIRSPLLPCLRAWQAKLRMLPDQQLACYVLRGLQEGFRVGFRRQCALTSASRNLPLAYQQSQIVGEYLQQELAAGRMLGPLPAILPDGQRVHINRVGVVPKGHTPGKWRMITDLSFPEGLSINDGVESALCSLEYTSVDRVAEVVAKLGLGTLMAKIDIKSAYRMIPVHPADRPLLGWRWEGQIFVDSALPFGLCSAPKIFTAVADVIEWCFREAGVKHVDHYLDDYIVLGAPGTRECAQSLEIVRSVAGELGVPLAEDKCEGPTTRLVFLGFEIDSTEGVLRLPQEKVERLQEMLLGWFEKKWCWRRDLESLIGKLQDAAKVIPPGRAFLRRIIDLLQGGWHYNHHIRLNRKFFADLRWWQFLLSYWNGVRFVPLQRPEVVVVSDASGSWGCGAYCGTRWFQLQWPEHMMDLSIAVKELIPIVLAVVTWGPAHRGARFCCYSDNEAAVVVVNSKNARDAHLLHLARCLCLFEAHLQLHVVARHLRGRDNCLADDLSRNRLHSFFSQDPLMMPIPSPLPLLAIDLLADPSVDWASESWIQLFRAIVP